MIEDKGHSKKINMANTIKALLAIFNQTAYLPTHYGILFSRIQPQMQIMA
jgi:hypothetical protein